MKIDNITSRYSLQRNPLISVIVPVYNTAEYLRECLDSIVGQSYTHFQIVLVDDGSTDGSGDICNEYAGRDKRIKVIHQKNAGVVCARKTGLREADGNYVYYVDSDDWVDRNIIESFMNIVSHYNVDMTMIGLKREYENGVGLVTPIQFQNGLYEKERIREEILPKAINTDEFFDRGLELSYWGYLINREILLQNIKDIDDHIRMGEELAGVYFCLLDAESLFINTSVYYHYRQRHNSLKRTECIEEYKNLQLLYKILVCRFAKETDNENLLKCAKYLVLFNILLTNPEKIEGVEGVFPYRKFPKGSKVVIYGAGVFGCKVIELLIQSGYANIVGWVDENVVTGQKKGISITPLETISQLEYDYIILGVLRANVRKDIQKTLEKYRIPTEKIIDIDLDKINRVSLPIGYEEF